MAEATIIPGDDGPYHVKGEFVLIDGEGNKMELTDETFLFNDAATSESHTPPFVGSVRGV